MGLRPYQNKDEKVLKVTKKMEDYVYIIDETSMLDLELANILFQALPSHSIIIFVGDVDQLPSVGIGNIFKDLLESGIEKYVLTQSHRQKENSTIITNARKVNNGDTQLTLKMMILMLYRYQMKILQLILQQCIQAAMHSY